MNTLAIILSASAGLQIIVYLSIIFFGLIWPIIRSTQKTNEAKERRLKPYRDALHQAQTSLINTIDELAHRADDMIWNEKTGKDLYTGQLHIDIKVYLQFFRKHALPKIKGLRKRDVDALEAQAMNIHKTIKKQTKLVWEYHFLNPKSPSRKVVREQLLGGGKRPVFNRTSSSGLGVPVDIPLSEKQTVKLGFGMLLYYQDCLKKFNWEVFANDFRNDYGSLPQQNYSSAKPKYISDHSWGHALGIVYKYLHIYFEDRRAAVNAPTNENPWLEMLQNQSYKTKDIPSLIKVAKGTYKWR